MRHTQQCAIRKEIVNHQTLVCISNLYQRCKHRLQARISSRITTVIRVVFTIEETIAVLPSHSQFRCIVDSYLHLHGLVLETSIYHWQDQPGSYRRKCKHSRDIFRSFRHRFEPFTAVKDPRFRPPHCQNFHLTISGNLRLTLACNRFHGSRRSFQHLKLSLRAMYSRIPGRDSVMFRY